MTIFIVGRIIKEVHRYNWPVWEILGAFTTIEDAVKRCKTLMDFVAPLEVDKVLPEETDYWPGIFYPLAEKDGEQ